MCVPIQMQRFYDAALHLLKKYYYKLIVTLFLWLAYPMYLNYI